MTQYEFLWHNKWLTADAHSIPEMIARLRAAANSLEEVYNTGKVTLENAKDISDDYACLITEDVTVANKYDFSRREDKDEEWDDCLITEQDDQC